MRFSSLLRLVVLAATTSAALAAASCASDDAGDVALRDPAAAADAILTRRAAEFDETVTGDGPAATVPSDEQPTAAPPSSIPGMIVNEFTLDIDECFDRVEDLSGGRLRIITTRLPCEEPHGAQIFGRLDYPAPHPSYYPGDDIMEDFALAACYVNFEAWADSVYETSILEIQAITPTRDDFEAVGFRGIRCYVERIDGEPLIGSARGSGL